MRGQSGHWVMVVDDEPGALSTLADVLLGQGYRPRVVSSVTMAKAVLEEEEESGPMIVDLALGDGDGIQLAEWVWARHPDTPILFVSAYTRLELVDRIKERGLPFFPKPMDLPRLLSALDAVTGRG